MKKTDKIYVAGHRGLVGSAIVRGLNNRGYGNLVTRTHAELDLINQQAVTDFYLQEKPDYVFLAAAKVGGIVANDRYPAEFIYRNLMIETNLIHGAYENAVKKLLFLGSTCIYPKLAPQPLKEEYLLSGPLEPTNEWYAVAKIAGIKLCQAYRRQYGCNFISAMPTNLFGPNDNFDLHTSHVLPALLRKFHEAKINNATQVGVWGTGSPRREFCYVDDCADACIYLMNNYNEASIINIGLGSDISIAELALMVKQVVAYDGEIVFDRSKPDGTPQKLVDATKILGLGWKPGVSLRDGVVMTYRWYLENKV